MENNVVKIDLPAIKVKPWNRETVAEAAFQCFEYDSWAVSCRLIWA